MRSPVASEVILFARVLMTHPRRKRRGLAKAMLAEVELAGQLVNDTGQAHPRFGDGSLMARCHRASPAREPMADDTEFLQALVIACNTLLAHSKA